MLLTIHNLPVNTRYCDVKTLIQSQCGLSEVLLDHLVKDGQYKKVTVGVVEEEDAAILVRKINGLYVQGAQLYVEDIRQKKKSSEQPYRPMGSLTTQHDTQQDNYNMPGMQSMNAQQNLPVPMNMQFSNMANYNQYMVPEMMPMMLNQQMMGLGMYVMPQQQDAFLDNSAQVRATSQTSTSNYNFNSKNQSASGMIPNNSFGNNKKRGRNDHPQNRDDDDADRHRNNQPYRGKQSRWGPEPNKPNEKRTRSDTRWNAGEAGPSGRRSRSPYRVDSREDTAFDSRYRNSPDRFDSNYQSRNAPITRSAFDHRDSNYDPRDDEEIQSYSGYARPMEGDERRYNQRDERPQRWAANNDRAQKGRDFHESDDRQHSDINQITRKRPNPDSFGANIMDRTWGESLTQSSNLNRYEGKSGPPQKIQRLPELMKQNFDSLCGIKSLVGSTIGKPSGREHPLVWENPPSSHGKRYSPPRFNPPGRGNSPTAGFPSVRENTFDRGNPAIRGNPSGRGNTAIRGNPSGRTLRSNSSSTGKPAISGDPSGRGNPAIRGDLSGRGNPAIRGNASGRGIPAIRGNASGRGNPAIRGDPSGRGNLAVRGNPSGRGSPITKGNAPVPKNNPSDYNAMIRRDTAWRQLAVAQISKQIFAEHNVPMSSLAEKGLLKAIKKAVLTRIDLLLKGEFAVPAPTILEKYRKRFPVSGDKVFLAAVVQNFVPEGDNVKQEENGTNKNQVVPAQQVKENVPVKREDTNPMPIPKTENIKQETESAKVPQTDSAKQIKMPAPLPKKFEIKMPLPLPKPKKSAPPTPVATSGKLPKYPKGDKAVHKQLRMQRKMEYENEDFYDLDPNLSVVLEKELDGLCNMIIGELSKPESKEEEAILKRLRVEPMIILRKSVKVSVIKRLLDIRTSLALMVFVIGKIPSPAIMSDFLRPYGVISLKKSEGKRKQKAPSFIVTCADFDSYDNLCSRKTLTMNNITGFKFKPLHVTPPKPSISRDDIKNHLSRQSQSIEQIQSASTDVIDFSNDEEMFYIDIPDVERVKKEGDDVKNDITTDDTDGKNDCVKKEDTGNDGGTNDNLKNENAKDDAVPDENTKDDPIASEKTNDDSVTDENAKNDTVTDENAKDDTVINENAKDDTVTNENANVVPVTNENANDVPVTNENDDTNEDVKNNDTNGSTMKKDEGVAFEEDATYDVDDGEDYFMMDGEEYRIEDEITDIKETDLEDY